MDKNKYKMVGIRIYHENYVDCLFKFLGDVTTETMIDLISDDNFNEFEWNERLPDKLEEQGIECVMWNTSGNCEDPLIPLTKTISGEEEHQARIMSGYDIYIELLSRNAPDGDEDTISQYVYLYSSEWNESRSIMHTSCNNHENDRFWCESYVSVLKSGDEMQYPSFWMDSRVASQDEKRCVPYYDKYIVLKYIRDINNCDDLRDYAEEETKERMNRKCFDGKGVYDDDD